MKKRKKHKFEKIKSHISDGRKYQVRWKAPKERDVGGWCSDPYRKIKFLEIDPDLSEKDLLRVAIDELIHSLLFQLDNFFVEEMSVSMSRFLWKMGWRLKK